MECLQAKEDSQMLAKKTGLKLWWAFKIIRCKNRLKSRDDSPNRRMLHLCIRVCRESEIPMPSTCSQLTSRKELQLMKSSGNLCRGRSIVKADFKTRQIVRTQGRAWESLLKLRNILCRLDLHKPVKALTWKRIWLTMRNLKLMTLSRFRPM